MRYEPSGDFEVAAALCLAIGSRDSLFHNGGKQRSEIATSQYIVYTEYL